MNANDMPPEDERQLQDTVPRPAQPIDTALAGLVGARLCHDLVGPVGAITNGLDLMAETVAAGALSAEDLALVTQSTTRAADLLRALRIAFGQTGSGGQPVPRERLLEDLRKVTVTRRVHLAALCEEGPPLPGEIAQVAALLVLCGRLVVGIAGTLELVFSLDAPLPLRLSIEGQKATLSDDMRAWLSGAVDPMPTSREVEFAILPRVVRAAGGVVDCEDDGAGRVVLQVRRA